MIQNPQSIKDNVLGAIESGAVKMRPKWKFALSTVAMIIGIALVLLTLLYLASFGVFILRQNGAWFAPGFGFEGWRIFLTSLPWVLVILSLIFIVLLELLVRHYSLVYGRPLVYSALCIIGLVIVGGVAVGLSPLHDRFLPEENRFPFAGALYHEFRQPPRNLSIGTVTATTTFGCELNDRRLGLTHIVISAQTENYGPNLEPGQAIMVLGPRQEATVTAISIRPLNQLPPPPPDGDNDGD